MDVTYKSELRQNLRGVKKLLNEISSKDTISLSYAVNVVEEAFGMTLEQIPNAYKFKGIESQNTVLPFSSDSSSYDTNPDLKRTLDRVFPGYRTYRLTGLRIIYNLYEQALCRTKK